MTSISTPIGQPGAPSSPVYVPATVQSSGVAKPTTPTSSEDKPAQVEPAKSTQSTPVKGFNPSMSIDADTHIVVMTIDGPDGKPIRQIPNEHELAAYKTAITEAKAKAAKA